MSSLSSFAPQQQGNFSPSSLAISLPRFTVRYREHIAAHGEGLTVTQGSRTAIVGPNGAGKTSLVKALLSLIPLELSSPEEAHILGMPLPLKGRTQKIRLAYLPQDQNLDLQFPITAWEVALMGSYAARRWWERLGAREHTETQKNLRLLAVDTLKDRLFGELSGGERQRVLLARALTQGSDLILMDEPLTGVDAGTAAHLKTVWATLSAAGKTIIAVHHDLSTLPEYFSHVIVLQKEILYSGALVQANQKALDQALQKAYAAYQLRF